MFDRELTQSSLLQIEALVDTVIERTSGIKDVDVSDKFRNLREPAPEKAAPAKAATAAERKAAPASDKAAVQAAAAAALAANARKSAPKAAEKPPVKSSDDEFDLDSILAEFK